MIEQNPRNQSGTLLIEGSGLQDSSGGSFSLAAPLNGGTGGTARACDFWRGLGREGRGSASLEAPADAERWTGDMGHGNDDDSDGGGGGFGGDYGGPEDEMDDQKDNVSNLQQWYIAMHKPGSFSVCCVS